MTPHLYGLLLGWLVLCPSLLVAQAIGERFSVGSRTIRDSHLVTALLATVVVYAIGSSVFGDGLMDLQKHMHLATVAFWPGLVASVVHVRRTLRDRRGRV